MGKTVNFKDTELYIVRQAIQNLQNDGGYLLGRDWAYRYLGDEVLNTILVNSVKLHKKHLTVSQS